MFSEAELLESKGDEVVVIETGVGYRQISSESREGCALSWKGFHGRKDSKRELLKAILSKKKKKKIENKERAAERVYCMWELGPRVEIEKSKRGLGQGEVY